MALQDILQDPAWVEVEQKIKEYIEPARDVMTIDTDQPSEVVHAEVRARQIAYDNLVTFLQNSGILKSSYEKPKKFSYR